MDEYEIFLAKDKRIRSFKFLAWLIVIINYLSLIYFSLSFGMFPLVKWILLALTGIIFFTVIYRVKKKNIFLGEFELLPVFIFIMFAWAVLGFAWIVLINGLLFLLSVIASRRYIVQFSTHHMVFPSFPRKTVSWKELSNVILKDGILTIDFRNNKVSQQEIDESFSPINEKEFNDFCKAQLHQ